MRKKIGGAQLLAKWMGERRQYEVATVFKICPAELNHYLTGRRTPALKKALLIEHRTKGAVPVDAWVG